MKTSTGLVVAVLVCALLGAGALGCNTFRGAGKDIQKGGEAVENAAENAQSSNQNGKAQPSTIMATAAPGGSILPLGRNNVIYGSNQTFTISAYNGYHVADVLVDGKSIGAVSRHTFDNVTVNHTISALFTVNPS